MVDRLRFTILGCGSSPGTPRINGDWGDCDPSNPKNRRTRCAAMAERIRPDGRATRVVLQGLPQRTTYIGRIRKDAKLYWPVAADSGKSQQPGRPRRYGALAPTPEQRLKDDTSWTSVRCFVAGQLRDIPVKTLGPFQRDEHEYLPLPKWRRLATGARPSLLDLLNLLRNQIFARNLHSPLVDIEGFLKNAPESVKPGKLPLTPEIQCTLAA